MHRFWNGRPINSSDIWRSVFSCGFVMTDLQCLHGEVDIILVVGQICWRSDLADVCACASLRTDCVAVLVCTPRWPDWLCKQRTLYGDQNVQWPSAGGLSGTKHVTHREHGAHDGDNPWHFGILGIERQYAKWDSQWNTNSMVPGGSATYEFFNI